MEFAIPQKWSGTAGKLIVLAIFTIFIAILTAFSRYLVNRQLLFGTMYNAW
jgi:hypothetical protein